MSWICKQCGLNNVNLVLVCYCQNERREFEPFDSIDEIISCSRLAKLDKFIGEMMTPQEQLFSELFNHEKVLVKDMDILVLRAHREELAKIAFEARARLTAVDDEENGRKKKAKDSDPNKPSGFSRSLNTDDKTSEMINTIKERQKGLSKIEKIVEGLIKLGYSRSEAEGKMSAGKVLAQVRASEKAIKETKTEETKLVFNPFEKK